MRIKKKFKKFIRNPRRFFRDSKLYLCLKNYIEGEEEYTEVLLQHEPEAGAELMIPREETFTISTIVELLSSQSAFFTFNDYDRNRLVLCTIEKNFDSLVKALANFSAEYGFQLNYDKRGRLVKPKTFRQLINDTESEKSINLRLTDLKSREKFYFEIQKWDSISDPESIIAPKGNLLSRKVWKRVVEKEQLLSLGTVNDLSSMFNAPLMDDVTFDVDFVYTWVNSEDSDWQKLYSQFKPLQNNDGNSISRFYSRDELKYSLRAIELYAPWVRRIHIVSNCKPPAWLDIEDSKINWVDHSEIFPSSQLPTFSSHAIESRLHNIPGLSNYFVYSNDDFMLSRPTRKSDFFYSNGICKLKLESWGNVNGDVREGEPDYLNAARNCQALLEKDFNYSPTQLHCHAPQALRVDVLKEMAEKYTESFETTGSNRFRSTSDIAVTGFLFHHYAYITGRAVKSNIRTLLIQQNHDFSNRYKTILKERSNTAIQSRFLSFCINDGADSHLNEEWNRVTLEFLNKYFSSPSVFEKDVNVL